MICLLIILVLNGGLEIGKGVFVYVYNVIVNNGWC